ncbi:hypothetical protein PT974_09078 [Cladobotryum mycophilum]|uniref:Uncharacterized protein n=1 Tax=Cladobotryum mycophilum TaxID=491253 RepID=A0ABR0SFA2_9HYPO
MHLTGVILQHQELSSRASGHKPPSSAKNGDSNCSANILDWIIFIGALVILCGSWWIVELPILFSAETHQQLAPTTVRHRVGHRLKKFWRAIEWNCTRSLMPSSVAVFAMARNSDPKSWPGLYYFGSERESQDASPLTAAQWTKIALTDAAPLLVHILLVYRGSAGLGKDSTLPPGSWLLPYLVAPVLGCYLVIISKLRRRVWRRFAIMVAIPVLMVVGAALVLISYFTATNRGFGPAFAGILASCWVVIMLPWSLMFCCGGTFHFVFFLYSAAARACLFILSMVGSPKNFPFCSGSATPLAIVSGVLGGIIVYWLGLMGNIQCQGYRTDLRKMIDIDPAAPRATEASQEELAVLQAEPSEQGNGEEAGIIGVPPQPEKPSP